MKGNLQDIDLLFTENLKEIKEVPPDFIWRQIENVLNRKDAKKYRAKYESLRKNVNAVLLLCVCLIVGDILQFEMNIVGKIELADPDYFAINTLNVSIRNFSFLINPIDNMSSKEALFKTIQMSHRPTTKRYVNEHAGAEPVNLADEENAPVKELSDKH
jgi:hypothetical protein